MVGWHARSVPNPSQTLWKLLLGTTGKPKGAIVTHRGLISVTRAQQMQHTGRTINDFHLSFLPLAHLMERFIFVDVIKSAATIGFYRGAPDYIMPDIQDYKPTHLPSVPRIWNRVAGAIVSAVMAEGGQKAVDEFWQAIFLGDFQHWEAEISTDDAGIRTGFPDSHG